jgi:hypothetical protein
MRSSEDYRRYASECLKLATLATDPQSRSTFLHMAQVWRRLAEQRDGVYRRNAAECLDIATTTDDPHVRVTMARMAEDWLGLTDRKRDADDPSKTTE